MKNMILVPAMYSETETREILGRVPDDFHKESDEFWSYVENRFTQLSPSINDVYMVCNEQAIDRRAVKTLEGLKIGGSEIHRLEDKALVGEVRAWYLAARNSKFDEELYEEANKDVNEALQLMVDSSLTDTEVGVVFFEPVCRLRFGSDFRVVRMSPFDPVDYINRHLVTQRL